LRTILFENNPVCEQYCLKTILSERGRFNGPAERGQRGQLQKPIKTLSCRSYPDWHKTPRIPTSQVPHPTRWTHLMFDTLLPLLGGLALLVVGGELLVRGAVALAERLGISPLLIGLTLVGFGTSTPELVTSVQASLAGSPGIAVGNIVGSNIANILLILGLSAIISPIAVGQTALRRDGAIVMATAILLATVSAVYVLDRLVGSVFVGLLASYILYAYRQERVGSAVPAGAAKAVAFHTARPTAKVARDTDQTAGNGPVVMHLMTALAGLAIVIVGGNFLVKGAVALARGYGISETVIGLTIVAVGTSMPEFVTSVVAAFKRQSDVALGNILGSNIYNILGIGGVTALLSPTIVPPEIVRFDNLVMVATSALLLVFAATGRIIGRLEGMTLITAYVGYLWVLWPR
jgi:cation:H+ antiporter